MVLLLLLLGTACASTVGKTIYVDDDAPADFNNIQAAIDDSNHGDVIVVKPGTHTGDGNRDIDFRGKAITVRSADPNDPSIVTATVIDCDGTEVEPHRAFKFHSAEGPDSVVAGLTITNGCAPPEYRGDLVRCAGGAVYCSDSSPTISRCRIEMNKAQNYGGAVYCGGNSSPHIEQCIVRDNIALWRGGAIICLDDSSPVIVHCTIADNWAGHDGGAIQCRSPNPVVHNCILWNNFARDYGPEICVWGEGSSLTISYSVVKGGRDHVNVYGHTKLNWGDGNLFFHPLLRPDLHLRSDSPCIDAGHPNFSPYPGQADMDGEPRMYGGRLDIGADEFFDSDNDGLPDWWEQKQFGDSTAGDANEDPDEDGRTNLHEYNSSSDPFSPSGTYYVDPVDGNDAWDGAAPTWDGIHGPKATIQAAIDVASLYDNETIILADGIYTGLGNRDVDFLGKPATVRSADPNDPAVVASTIIDCNGKEAEPHRGFHFHSAEDANSILDGLTITNGWGHPVNRHYSGGGAILCENGNPTIRNCIIKGNSADRGGGIYCGADGNPTVDFCTISGNAAQNAGGGICCSRGSLNIIDCTIASNSGGYSGGGLYSFYSTTNIQGCEITGNSAKRGGGISCRYHGEAIVSNCVFKSNSASAVGGAVFSEDNRTTINSCLIAGNSAEYGGGITSDEDEITIRNCPIAQNAAHNEGGGIWCWDTMATVEHCTIADNSADYGGGITHASERGASLQFMNSILSGNTANYGPQVAFIRKEYSAPGEVRLAISYCNLQGGQAALYSVGAPCLEPQCVLDWGSGNSSADPLFVDPGSGDYRLLVDSPCINTGDPEYIASPEETDLDGQPRVLNWRVDMGAYENIAQTGHIGFSPIAMEFRALQGGPSPEPQILTVGNCGTGSIDWQITESCPWLQVAPTSDESTGERDEVTVSVDSSGLHRGLHTCELIVTANDAANSPQTIMVTLHIGGELHVPPSEGIQWAIDAAVHGDTIIVAPGRYTGYGNRDIDFHGKAITVRSIDPNDPNIVAATVIDGGHDPSSPYFFERHHGFIFRSGEGRDSVIDGLTIANFYAPGESLGGGIYCVNSSPTISRCIIRSNVAYGSLWHGDALGFGGGIYCGLGSSPRIIRCSIIGNRSRFGAAGIDCENGNPVIDRCTIRDNDSSWRSGAISCSRGNATITGCTISDNCGGGVFCAGNSVVSHCIVRANRGNPGVGLWDNAILSYCTITDNVSDPDSITGSCGGGVLCADNATIDHCIIAGNSSKHHPGDELGGVIEGAGGGIYCAGGSPTITSCTITQNKADDYGGGIYSAGDPVISNCIVWANQSPNEPEISGSSIVMFGDVQGGTSGTGNLSTDPCFAAPGYRNDNGTPAEPWDDFWVDGDYHLRSQAGRWDPNNQIWVQDDLTSPCIDAGDRGSDWTAELWPHGRRINMGAYGGTPEASMSLSSVGNIADLNNDDLVSCEDLMLFGEKWPWERALMAEDLNRDGIVDSHDFAVFADEWRQTSLIGHWPFDEAEGIIAHDAGIGGNDCTLMGDTAWVDDPIRGTCLDFDGDGGYVKTADTTKGLDFAPDSFSISAWINPRQVTGGWRTILEYDRYTFTGSNWFGIWLNNEGRFHFRVGLGTKNSRQKLNPDEWYLVVATYDSPTRQMSLYVNGELDDTRTLEAEDRYFSSPAVSKLTIATYGHEDGEYFDGRIDDVRIYSFALSHKEIAALKN